MAERRDTDLFEVLIGQIRQNNKANVILGKALSVLLETELLEPLVGLMHCDPPTNLTLSVSGAAGQKVYHARRPIEACCRRGRTSQRAKGGRWSGMGDVSVLAREADIFDLREQVGSVPKWEVGESY